MKVLLEILLLFFVAFATSERPRGPKKEPLRNVPIIISPKDKSIFYASLGQSIRIECKAMGFGPQVHFQLVQVKKADSNNGSGVVKVVKKPMALQLSEGARGNRKTHTVIFHFDNISKKDFAEFICLSGNSMGYDTRSFTIKEKPSTRTQRPEPLRNVPIIISPKDKSIFYASLGQSIRIECKAMGFGPQVHFQLVQVKKADSNNGSGVVKVVKKPMALQLSEGARGNRKTHTVIFHFDNISKKDFAEFICLSGNSMGYDTRSFTIKEKPSTRTQRPELHKMLKNRASKLGRVACNKGFQTCTKSSTDAKSMRDCRLMLRGCKQKIMEMISKIGQVKPTGKQGGRKHGGRKQGRHHRPGPKQHFCQCFKRLVVCIKKHHNKTMTDKDGQKITVHEDIFMNAQSAVAGPGQAGMGSMDNPLITNPKKQCVRRFRCCLQRGNCGGQKGKGRRRKQRDSNKMKRKGKRGGKGGRPRTGSSQKHGPRPSPFRGCVVKAKKCKQNAGKSRKQLKLCAKNFVKCMLKICSKGKKN